MKAFLDSSVLVPVFYEDHEHHERSFALFRTVKPQTACTAAHCLVETYGVLTGRPGKYRASPDEALLFLGSVRERLSIITLNERQYIQILTDAAANGVAGATVHDAIIAGSAIVAKARAIYTWNLKHFVMLGSGVASLVRNP